MCRNIHFRLVNRIKSSNNAKEQNEGLGGIHFPFLRVLFGSCATEYY